MFIEWIVFQYATPQKSNHLQSKHHSQYVHERGTGSILVRDQTPTRNKSLYLCFKFHCRSVILQPCCSSCSSGHKRNWTYHATAESLQCEVHAVFIGYLRSIMFLKNERKTSNLALGWNWTTNEVSLDSSHREDQSITKTYISEKVKKT